jgi:hypothetical protein
MSEWVLPLRAGCQPLIHVSEPSDLEFRRFLHLIRMLPAQIVRSGRRIITGLWVTTIDSKASLVPTLVDPVLGKGWGLCPLPIKLGLVSLRIHE